MKVVKADLPASLESAEIVTIADWHYADPQSNHGRILQDIEYIRTHNNCYCVLNGDIMNCAITSSVSDTYGDTLSPMEELRECTRLFEPLARDGKILCVNPGNHERRHYKTNGIDITELMCRQLGIEDRYSPTSALVFIRLGKQKDKYHGRKVLYTMYVTHGNGGGRKEGGKINRLADLASIVDTDIYIHSHTHTPAVMKQSFYRLNQQKASVNEVEKLFVNSSAMLSYGGYGQVASFKPSSNACPVIYLTATRAKKMWATL